MTTLQKIKILLRWHWEVSWRKAREFIPKSLALVIDAICILLLFPSAIIISIFYGIKFWVWDLGYCLLTGTDVAFERMKKVLENKNEDS